MAYLVGQCQPGKPGAKYFFLTSISLGAVHVGEVAF
jgi:hypothetical protein